MKIFLNTYIQTENDCSTSNTTELYYQDRCLFFNCVDLIIANCELFANF